MIKIIFLLGILLTAALLAKTSLYRTSKEQQQYEKNGMRLVSEPKIKQLMLPAVGLLTAVIVSFFMYLAIEDGAWEDAAGMMLLCIGVTAGLLVVCFFAGYCMQRRHILYDEQKILVGRIFQPYEVIYWFEIGRMEIKNQDFFNLYDRENRRRIAVNAGMEGYGDFYVQAYEITKPEQNAVSERSDTAWAGCGVLRCRTGEAYVMIILGLLLAGMTLVLVLTSGEGLHELLLLFLDEQTAGIWFVPFILLFGIGSAVYRSRQEITYDSQKLIIKHFLRRNTEIFWDMAEQVECRNTRSNDREIVLYTNGRKYIISESKFRKGFSEFVCELQKMGKLEM